MTKQAQRGDHESPPTFYAEDPTERKQRLGRSYIDMEGTTVGGFLVLGLYDTHPVRWHARCCMCGEVSIREASALRTREPTGCRACVHGQKAEDLAGRVFGRWTVLRRTVPRRLGATFWLCRCECGREQDKAAWALKAGESRGCLRCATSRALGHAGRVEGATRGTCSWCDRPAQRKPFECDACDRSAVRNGRDEDGRPRCKMRRFVDPEQVPLKRRKPRKPRPIPQSEWARRPAPWGRSHDGRPYRFAERFGRLERGA